MIFNALQEISVMLINQSGYRKYRHAQFHGVVHGSTRRSNVQRKYFLDGLLEKLMTRVIGSQKVKILIDKSP